MLKNLSKVRMMLGFTAGMSIVFSLAFFSNVRASVQDSKMLLAISDSSRYPYATESGGAVPSDNPAGGYTGSTTNSIKTTNTPSPGQVPWIGGTPSSHEEGTKIEDKIAPTAPANLLAGQADGQDAVLLWWGASRDAVGVQKYLVYRNGVKLAESTATKYLDATVSIGGQYIYFIVAQDAVGNLSERSKAATLSFPVVKRVVPGVSSGGGLPPSVSGVGNTATNGTTTTNQGSGASQSGGKETPGTGIRIDDGGMLFAGSDTKNSANGATERAPVLVSLGSSGVLATLGGSVVVKNGTPGTWVQPKDQKKEDVSQQSDFTMPMPAWSVKGIGDQDNDGLSDAEEARRGTSLSNGDTDGDGFSDGDEVKSGYNPLKYGIDAHVDRIAFQSPKETPLAMVKQPAFPSDSAVEPMVRATNYQVEKVERVNYESGKQTFQLSGRATPNSFVTVYLYSEPMIAIVETDAFGEWTYGFDGNLEDGGHEAYVTATDNEGNIVLQSDPLPFIKTANAVTVTTVAATPSKNIPEEQMIQIPEEESVVNTFIIIGIFVVTLLSLGGITIRHFMRKGAQV